MLIGERTDTGLNILGFGMSPTDGLRRGVVVNMDKTTRSIKQAIEAAEHTAGVQTGAVYVGIAGEHIESVNSRGAIAISRTDHGITQKDIARVFEAASALQIPMDRQVIHTLAQEFIVDDQRGIPDPDGLYGVRLEVLVHIVTGAITSKQNLYKCINRAGLEVKDLVLDSFASSFAVLSSDEKELGVILLDLGGGTTDLAIFYEGSIRHSAVIPIGGKNLTSDIAIGLRTPLERAEEIKLNHCRAIFSRSDEDAHIEVPGVGGRPQRKVSQEQLASIVGPRMEEIFSFAHREMKRSGYDDHIGAGVVLTGGGALMPGTVELAEQVFGIPAKIGIPDGHIGLVDEEKAPMFATGIGLMLYALESPERKEWTTSGGTGLFDRLYDRMKSWFENMS
ncbi:MAG TPA: cell division protein FtsA [Candidatus Latescibacteria bacterium]|nr:cell division protein FtsA [Candidatus Latescibacterota bacterium]